MLQKNKTELMDIVYHEIVDCGSGHVAKVIGEAHMGRPGGCVTNQNLHLFRQYRNLVSPDPAKLVGEAMKINGWHRVVFADELDPCDSCTEPYCEECDAHFGECDCPGPTQDGWEYRSFGDELWCKEEE